MAQFDKNAVTANMKMLEDVAGTALAQTGETGDNTGLSLDNKDKDKDKKNLKSTLQDLGNNIKEDPAAAMSAVTSGMTEPLKEYQQAQQAKQAVPKADELAPEPVDLMAAFNI